MGGRPTKYTVELARRIGRMIEAGQSFSSAAMICGIPPETVDRWMREGREEGASKGLKEFCLTLARARGKAIASAERAVFRGLEKHKKSKLNWLRAMHRPEWTIRQEIKTEQAGQVTLMFEDLSPAEIARRVAAKAQSRSKEVK